MANLSTPIQHPYQDPSLATSERVNNLISLMTLPEKAGQLFHTMIAQGPNSSLAEANPAFGLDSTKDDLHKKFMTHFNLIGHLNNPRATAEWHNNLQREALTTRLGIPITLSTDPRNHFTDNIGTSFNAGAFSQWPETLGFAAMRDPDLVERFANIARQEYLAVGLRVALHPQIDLSTEPRWARINATFGEDTDLAGELGAYYIRGFQGTDGKVGKDSVSCMTKHFPGGGPQKDGEDPHFDYGKEQVYPGGCFEYHLKPFLRAIRSGTSQMMPYYGMPVGLEADVEGKHEKEKIEEVGFAFNKQIITKLLRENLGYDGIVCTDWGLLTDNHILGQAMPARAWGCENLTRVERAAKIIDAGCDQFGGEACPEVIIEAVEKGLTSEKQIDKCVARLLQLKFDLGLFDEKRSVDVEAVEAIIGQASSVNAGEEAQRRCYTLLKNDKNILPLTLTESMKIYVEGFDEKFISTSRLSRNIVKIPEEADVALIRLKAPFEPRTGGFEAYFHAGSLEFPEAEKQRQAKIYSTVNTVVDIYLDRPAVIPEIAEHASALLCSYGSSANAFLDVVLGVAKPESRLPFDLPRSTAAIAQSPEDVPFSTKDPIYRYGDGLAY